MARAAIPLLPLALVMLLLAVFACTGPIYKGPEPTPTSQKWKATCAVSCAAGCGGGNFPQVVCADSEIQAIGRADTDCNSFPPCYANFPGCPSPQTGSCNCFQASPMDEPCN